MIEHRLPARLSDYWERIRHRSPIPSMDWLNPQEIADLWQNCLRVAVEVQGGKPIYTYEYVGDNLESIFGNDLVGKKVNSKPSFLPATKMIEKMDKSVKNPFPITVEGQFLDERSKMVNYRACLLPFGSSRQNVTHFVTGLSWKIL